MSVWYGLTFAASLLLSVVCSIKFKKDNPHMSGLFLSVLLVNLGYFLLSISKNVSIALLFNSISYFGSVFLPLFMLLIISDLSKITIQKKVVISLFVISIVIFVIATSAWFSDVYYRDVWLTTVNNATVLNKEYGSLHPVYKIYVISYLTGMIGMIVYSIIRKKGKNFKITSFLTIIVSINIGVWLIESVTHSYFEYMSVAYVVTEVLLLLFYSIINDFSADSISPAAPVAPAASAAPVVQEPVEEFYTPNEIKEFMQKGTYDKLLTKRERDVLALLLEGKRRKEIAEKLSVTESTIKKHLSSIYKKLDVENKKELLLKVKAEK